MKIEHRIQNKQINILSNKNVDNIDKNNNFADFLQKEQRQNSKEQLNLLLEQIDEQGKKLFTTRNMRELATYKALIKRFMEEIINNALTFEDKYSYDSIGRKKRYKIIKEIDEKLIKLTNMILDKESDKLDILEEMGDIRGLIINLYY